MKNSFLKKLALGMVAVMVVGSLSACGKTESDSSTEVSQTTESAETSSTEEASVEDNKILVAGYDQFSGKFSPFFAQTAYDQDAQGITQIGLLSLDREGNVVMNGIEGETRSYNGTDYTYYGISDLAVTQNDDGSVYYDFTMRDDLTFSDGTPITIDDVIFSMYVSCDPTYDGASTLYAVPIEGMEDYRKGMEVLGTLIWANGADNTDFSLYTQEQQDQYISAVNEAGQKWVQDIIDCLANDYGVPADEFGGEVAMGMVNWGFGELNEDGTVFTGAATGFECAPADLTNEMFFNEVNAAYGGNLQEASDTESAYGDLFTYINEILGDDAAEYQKGVSTGEGAANISGIQKTGDYSMRIVTTKFDATSVYHLGVTVAPMHYYGSADLYDYDNNMFGFVKGDLSSVRAKTAQPLGAGPYVFESYENGVITYSANDSYFQGAPKVKTLLFRETSEGDKLSGITSGSFDIANPAMSVEVLNKIKSENANGELQGEKLHTALTDFLGYGYIGINARNLSVGGVQDSDESKNLRKAFATVLSVYRDTVIDSYYADMASVIQYPISNTSWAAPKPADEGYEIAYSVDVDGNPIYTADMDAEQKYAAALEAAVGFFKAAGYTFDEATGMFTAAPEGAEMSYEIIIPASGAGDHPSFGILTATKEALATIGITLEINDPSDPNILWDAINAGTGEMWCAAWGATPDPDMYQVYYSGNVVENKDGSKSNNYHIQDPELDELIMEGRSNADQTFRKATYKQCLDIIKDWAVEVPVYQRQDGFLFSSERINVDTLTPDMTPYWGWIAEVEKIEMN